MNILVTGASGQLGSEFKALSKRYNRDHIFYFTDIETLDVTSKDSMLDYFKSTEIDLFINCAGYTAVDDAEDNKELANSLNNKALSNIAALSNDFNFKVIHFSTDYIFDGKKNTPYTELDSPLPLSVYGASKLEGEKRLVETAQAYTIIRTSWLYSTFGNNFVKTILRLARSRDELGVIYDQVGTPTFTEDLVWATFELISSPTKINKNIYNFSNEGVASWYDFAKEIVDVAGINCNVLPIETSEFKAKALRPSYSVLNKKKIKSSLNIPIRHWRDALKACMKKMSI